MKTCPNCHATSEDDATFCASCGTPLGATAQPVVQPRVPDPADHTAEFTPEDISENKIIAMLPYLLSVAGIIIALLASQQSKYVGFHLRQALKLTVISVLLSLITAVLCWTFIVPIAGGIAITILLVLRIIAFVQVCKGEAKEPAIIRDFKFLK